MRRALAMLAALGAALGTVLAATAAVAGPPAAPPPALAAAVGEYGPDDGLLTVYEDAGRLFVDGRGWSRAPLQPLSPGSYAPPDAPPRALAFEPGAVIVDGRRLPARDVGAEAVAAIQAGTRADPAALRAAALAASPPAEPAPRRPADLVDLTGVDPTIRLDIRYAGSDNFMGFALYERPAAYLQRPAAEALGRVARALAAQGYGLLVHDAYRPWFVTRMFWDATPEASRIFVADPARGSRHNRGCAVDLTLYDLATGQPVEMTGRYDEMSRRSFADYPGGTGRQRWLRDLLRREMEKEGFVVLPEEWWHFDYKDWADYGIGNQTFEALAGSATPRP
ncbi:MAG: M15 family metallopeptidase [Phenylobacterium sp.]|uniref:M15 family metallopeptidase n=1 Tax=Phenylobacterium sp. TaxID=1871053 RepID=UPI003919835F